MNTMISLKCVNYRCRAGVVLLLTLVLLVILSVLGYTLSARVADERHRTEYIVNYSKARYGCQSALKYALTMMQKIDPELISRPNEPDFSDLFHMTDAQRSQFLDEWVTESVVNGDTSWLERSGVSSSEELDEPNRGTDGNSVTIRADSSVLQGLYVNSLTIRGPYGPAWPYVTEPMQLEIGSAKVTIEIEDENAKYPIGLAMLQDEQIKRESQAGFETFCEWMNIDDFEIEQLRSQLEELSKIKQFKKEFKPIETMVSKTITYRYGRSRVRRIKKKVPGFVHHFDFARLFHSSLIDRQLLGRPIAEEQLWTPLKYISLWTSRKVNINTAPRHVLEAVFTFGGDAVDIAESIIRQRRIKPFDDIEDIRKSLLRYSDSIERSKDYITTKSNFFTVRVTSVSATARVSAVAAVIKDGDKIQKIGVIFD